MDNLLVLQDEFDILVCEGYQPATDECHDNKHHNGIGTGTGPLGDTPKQPCGIKDKVEL